MKWVVELALILTCNLQKSSGCVTTTEVTEAYNLHSLSSVVYTWFMS